MEIPFEDLTPQINSMSSAEAFDDMARLIVKKQPQDHVLLFGTLYRRRSELLREAGADEEADKDRAICDLLTDAVRAPPAGRNQSYNLFAAAVDGSNPWQHWSEFEPPVFKALWIAAEKHRAVPAVRAFLLQALWERKGQWSSARMEDVPSVISILELAVAAHVEAAGWYLGLAMEPRSKALPVVRHWMSAHRLAVEVGKPEWIQARYAELWQAQVELLDEAADWGASLVEIEVMLAAYRGDRQPDLVSDSRLEELLALLADISLRVEAMDGLEYVEHDILALVAEVEKCLNRGPDQQTAALRRAQLYDRQARRASFFAVEQERLKSAAQEYFQAGRREEAARMMAQAREVIEDADASGQLKSVVLPFEVKDEDTVALLEPFFGGAESADVVLHRLGGCLVVPSLEFPDRTQPVPASLMAQFATTMPLVGDRSHAPLVPGTPEHAQFQRNRALVQEIHLTAAMVISEVLQRLRQEFQLRADQLTGAMSASPFIVAEDLPFIRSAVRNYLGGDNIAAMHVLVPRVEQVIRRVLKAARMEITALRDGALREKPLGTLLREAESKGVLPPELAQLLRATLSEEWGINLRNSIAHGWIKQAQCTQYLADLTLHLMLLVVRLRPKATASSGASAPAEALAMDDPTEPDEG